MALSVVDVVARAAVRHPMPAVMYELLSVNESLPGAMTMLPAIIRLDADLERRLADVSRGDGSWRERTASRTLERGLAEIGFRRVHSAALLITAMKALPIEIRVFDYLDFWRYSIAVSFVATSLAYARRVEGREYAYAAGLFHDVGRLILEEDDPVGLQAVRGIQLRGGVPWHEVERSALGYTALDLSVALARAWRLAPASALSRRNRRTGTGQARRANRLTARWRACGSDARVRYVDGTAPGTEPGNRRAHRSVLRGTRGAAAAGERAAEERDHRVDVTSPDLATARRPAGAPGTPPRR